MVKDKRIRSMCFAALGAVFAAVLATGTDVYASMPQAWPTPIVMPTQPATAAAAAATPAVTTQTAAVPTTPTATVPTTVTTTPAATTPAKKISSSAATLPTAIPTLAPVALPKVNLNPLVTQAPVVTKVEKTATPVTVDLIIFAGQSNMSGNGGNAAQAPLVPAGQGYEYRPTSSPNALYPLIEPFGRNERGYISDQPTFQNGTLVSSFVTTYFKKTLTPVVAVPATHGGTDSGFWASPATKADLLSRYLKAKAYLENNNFKVRRKFLVFLQGENDAVSGTSAFDYKNNLTSAFQPLFANGLEQVFLITPGYASNGTFFYDQIYNAQIDLCNSNNMFSVGSTILHSPAMNAYLNDTVHYNQQGLNAAGTSAGAKVASFANGGI